MTLLKPKWKSHVSEELKMTCDFSRLLQSGHEDIVATQVNFKGLYVITQASNSSFGM